MTYKHPKSNYLRLTRLWQSYKRSSCKFQLMCNLNPQSYDCWALPLPMHHNATTTDHRTELLSPDVSELAGPLLALLIEHCIPGLAVFEQHLVNLLEHGGHTLGRMLVKLLKFKPQNVWTLFIIAKKTKQN